MPKDDRKNGKSEKGYRPLNEGYTPRDDRGYAPSAKEGGLPKAPKGGTGESTKPTSPTGSGNKKP
jgi:hypothetical protein